MSSKLLSTIYYIRTSMARTSLGPWIFVLDVGSPSDFGIIITLGQEANGDNLGTSFLSSIEYWYVECSH